MLTLAEWRRQYDDALRNLTAEEQQMVESTTRLTSPQLIHARRCYQNWRLAHDTAVAAKERTEVSL